MAAIDYSTEIFVAANTTVVECFLLSIHIALTSQRQMLTWNIVNTSSADLVLKNR